MIHREYDVIIIGAGIIGCAIAFELAKKGFRTFNVDKLPMAGFGSTGSSSAIIRTHYSTWDGIAMSHEAVSYWKDWKNYISVNDESGYSKYVNTGALIIKHEGFDFVRILKLFDEIGVLYKELPLSSIEKKMPFLDLHSFWPPTRPSDEKFWEESNNYLDGFIYMPDSGYVPDPQLATHNLQIGAESHGAHFGFRNEIISIRQSNNRVTGITLSDGIEINSPIVINASGPHSSVINQMAGVKGTMNINTRPLRQEVHFAPSPERVDFECSGCYTFDGDSGIYFRPEVGNKILVGSEEPECDSHEWVDDPDNFNRQVGESQWEAQIYRLAKRIPDLPIPTKRSGIVDLYDVSDDWIPIYDKSDLGGFYMAVGTSGNQFKNAPVVGHFMAELVEACEHGQDHDTDPVQVKCRYTGLILNAGFYSRNRKINKESTFTVNA